MLVGIPSSARSVNNVESRICLRRIVDGDQEPDSRPWSEACRCGDELNRSSWKPLSRDTSWMTVVGINTGICLIPAT
jgi:hypothetical protein